MATDMTEGGLEKIITQHLIETNGFELTTTPRTKASGTSPDYDREYALDTVRLCRFIRETQPDKYDKLKLGESDKKRREFFGRVRDEITKRGIIDVLRKGVKAYPADVVMFYVTPSAKNDAARKKFEANIWSVARQVEYAADASLALDMALFVNGLPIMTLELKNRQTHQNVTDAVAQYQNDRSPKELLFMFKRCMVHFALDDERAMFCTRIDGARSVFLPFNKGTEDGGAGNPPNPNGIMTDYMWREIMTKTKLARIIEQYAHVVEKTDPEMKKKSYVQIFPRYHQLDVVERLLADVREHGVGRRYLIQHSAGSGKSNSIAWLALQLMNLEDENGDLIVDTVLVLTDRRILDKQTRDTLYGFAQMKNIVKWAQHSGDLKKGITDGARVIVSTIEKFPFIKDIDDAHKDNRFAIIIDEAHSGQTGRNSAWMNSALKGLKLPDDATDEDVINALAEGRHLLPNASYFAFTATPKNKTLETFGEEYTAMGEDKVFHRPFHVYTMKQAIQEGFILDVLANYTPIKSYFRLIKTVEDDPEFDRKRAMRKLSAFVQSQTYTIEQKAAMMVEHFHENVIAKGKIEGQARAMIVTDSIESCIEYFYAVNKLLDLRQSPYKAIVAFSGEHEFRGVKPAVTSEKLNGFSDSTIETQIKHDPYRFLIVADMFQTGYDEPLLHTMYVDKMLSGVKAVQTLSRLNRARRGKSDTFVLDFRNDPEDIEKSFSRYYKTTILSGETDPNKLNDLMSIMEEHEVYSQDDVERATSLYLKDAPRERIDPIADRAADRYGELDTDAQIKFKSAAKAFVRTYAFLGSILPYPSSAWERLSIFLYLLVPKLPSPKGEDFTDGLLEAVDFDSYRIEAQSKMKIALADEDSEVGPVPTGEARGEREPDLGELSSILADFHDIWGDIEWKDEDHVKKQISDLPDMVLKDIDLQNAIANSSKDVARQVSDKVLEAVINGLMLDNIELFKQYTDNESFRKMLAAAVFNASYNRARSEIGAARI